MPRTSELAVVVPPTREKLEEKIKLAEAYEAAHPEHHAPYRFPFILPADWRCEQRYDNRAIYRRADKLLVLCSSAREEDGKHWLHVSMSFPHRLPSYAEMGTVKALFLGRHRTAYQIFPDEAQHINDHPFCLHLWCCMDGPVTPDFTHGIGTI